MLLDAREPFETVELPLGAAEFADPHERVRQADPDRRVERVGVTRIAQVNHGPTWFVPQEVDGPDARADQRVRRFSIDGSPRVERRVPIPQEERNHAEQA